MLLEMKNIVKTYGNVVANNKVNINLNKGEILAVVGENGAGKSTIMKILYGLEKPDSGEIFIDGKKMNFHNPSDAMKQGIGMVQQHFMLFESMTVAENIVYKNEMKKGIFFDYKKNIQMVEELSKRYMLDVDPNAIVEECPVGLQQRVEILKTLYQSADIIIFDEPSAVLTPIEVDELLKTMKQLAKLGKSLIIITHKLHEVMEVADRVVVMRLGEVVAEKLKKDTSIEELSYLMVGRQIANRVIPEKETKEQLLEVKNLTLKGEHNKNILNNVNLHIKKGEIVGIAGVSGNGQSELIRCITGLDKVDSGNVIINKKDITNNTVMGIREAGIAHIPEDRYMWGSAPEATLAENALMGYEDSEEFSKKGILNINKVTKHAVELISKFRVKADSHTQKIKELSGGNAQKLIVAREMSMETPLIIACEPTRGIDIGAIEFIHDQLVAKRNKGDSVLLVSSELSEIMDLSDRIYVIYDGEIVGEFKRGSIDEKALGLLMVGGKNNEK